MRLTVISNVQPTPLTTVALFRFRYINSDLSLTMSNTCQFGDPANCTIPNALPAPCGGC